jgi:hypothetical protein
VDHSRGRVTVDAYGDWRAYPIDSGRAFAELR